MTQRRARADGGSALPLRVVQRPRLRRLQDGGDELERSTRPKMGPVGHLLLGDLANDIPQTLGAVATG
eukprot:9430320-Heterocapsa_arctica.AAC.1